jgi:hypothetical protein
MMVKMEKNWQAEKTMNEKMKENSMQKKTIQMNVTIA